MADAYSPEWYRDRLLVALDKQVKRVARLEKYYSDGYATLPEPPKGMSLEVFAEAKVAFLTLSQLGVTNWVRMVARAPLDRLSPQAVRFGDNKAAMKRGEQAWALYEANQLGTEFPLALETTFVTGQAYGSVWPSDAGPPVMTCEHPAEVVIAYEAGSRRKRVAALKRWMAEDGQVMVTLYMPRLVYKWQGAGVTASGLALPENATTPFGATWKKRQPTGELWPLPNPLGVVPVIEFAINTGLKARPFGGGVGEFEGVLTIQDRINKTIFDRLVTAEHQAFRQRWSIGWDPPIDPVTKEPDPRATFRASQAALWTFSGADPTKMKIGEFGQADFQHFIAAVESDVNAMAAITQTPPHYLLGAMVNISGDAITAAESGITSKTKTHAQVLSDPLEEYLRLGLRAAGNTAAADMAATIIWDDIERRSWAEKIDGLIKLAATFPEVPREEFYAMVPGMTPQDVARWKASAVAPPAPAPPV